ncbi:MAG: hypothetical protein DRJ30_03100 [Candidatus Methanomethylicota archaeon]|nr:MAG: hypothetical protein DRJ30_03100 [Candidatus Verstraetearchaeota archaeon]
MVAYRGRLTKCKNVSLLWIETLWRFKPSDVGLRGYSESSIRAFKLDDGETVDRPKFTFIYKSLSIMNPINLYSKCSGYQFKFTFGGLSSNSTYFL